jgi:DNA-binding transcriptional regulator YdaS (Cro superfamily)
MRKSSSAEEQALAIWQELRVDPGILAIAHKLGLSRQAVQQWRRVPGQHILAVSAFTKVPGHRLRPDLAEAVGLRRRRNGRGK